MRAGFGATVGVIRPVGLVGAIDPALFGAKNSDEVLGCYLLGVVLVLFIGVVGAPLRFLPPSFSMILSIFSYSSRFRLLTYLSWKNDFLSLSWMSGESRLPS